jgi:hypothetical protein
LCHQHEKDIGKTWLQSKNIFRKYAEEAEHLNSQYEGTAEILEFNSNTNVIIQLLSKPEELSYMQVRSILDHTVKFNDGVEADLFSIALDIYVGRKYYIYESLEGYQKTENVEQQSIENYFREEWERIQQEETEYQSAAYNIHKKEEDCPF